MKEKLKALWRRGVDALSAGVDRLQAAWPVEKLVKALNPVISMVAGAAAAWLAGTFPGLPPMASGYLAGIFGLVAAGTFTTLNKIIDGWQADIARQHEAEQGAEQRASEERIAAMQQARIEDAPDEVLAAAAAAAEKVTVEAKAATTAAGVAVGDPEVVQKQLEVVAEQVNAALVAVGAEGLAAPSAAGESPTA